MDITHQLYSAKQSAKGSYVAALINLAQQWFVSLLSRFMLQYPQIDIELTISNKNIDLIENHVDLAIRVGEMTTPDWIVRHPTDIPFCLCMSTANDEHRGFTIAPTGAYSLSGGGFAETSTGVSFIPLRRKSSTLMAAKARFKGG